MKIFLAGASGAIGRRLMPLLIQQGYEVYGVTRTAERVNAIKSCGALPIVVDVLDRDAICDAVASTQPDVVIHELTALSDVTSYRNLDRALRPTNELRTRGLDNLLLAATKAGAKRFIAQSFGGWPNGRSGPRIKTEREPLEQCPLPSMVKSLAAIRHVEETVPSIAEMDGIVLRYGQLYGPGTGFSPNASMFTLIQKRSFPLIGRGCGVWSFVHVDDAASATLRAIRNGEPGIYNVVDDEPTEISTWLPYLADLLQSARPYSVPAWLGRILAGEAVTVQMTEIKGLSNEKARQAFGWHPIHSSWRTGFADMVDHPR